MAPRTAAKKTAGFWDEHEVKGGSAYLDADEKKELISSQAEFSIVGVEYDEENQYEGKPSPGYVVTILLPDPITGDEEERKLRFAEGLKGRDEILGIMLDVLEAGEVESIPAQLYKKGRALVINKPGL
jgi:hypothetical protein